jgi:hypothetical protein
MSLAYDARIIERVRLGGVIKYRSSLILPCVLLFPIGLLSLLDTRTVDISFIFVPASRVWVVQPGDFSLGPCGNA